MSGKKVLIILGLGLIFFTFFFLSYRNTRELNDQKAVTYRFFNDYLTCLKILKGSQDVFQELSSLPPLPDLSSENALKLRKDLKIARYNVMKIDLILKIYDHSSVPLIAYFTRDFSSAVGLDQFGGKRDFKDINMANLVMMTDGITQVLLDQTLDQQGRQYLAISQVQRKRLNFKLCSILDSPLNACDQRSLDSKGKISIDGSVSFIYDLLNDQGHRTIDEKVS